MGSGVCAGGRRLRPHPREAGGDEPTPSSPHRLYRSVVPSDFTYKT